jgi:HAD hydrolase, family IA, variant 1
MIVFDLDDTLFDEREFCRSAYTEITAELSSRFQANASRVLDAMWSALMNRDNPFTAMEEELEREKIAFPPGLTKEMVTLYRAHRPFRLTPGRGVTTTLERLRRDGVRTGIITDGRSTTQRAKIVALGIGEFFDNEDILISEELGADKRSELMFRRLMETHPDEKGFVYVGDNTEKDFTQPNLLGWTTVCLRHIRAGVHPQDFRHTGAMVPDLIVSNLTEILVSNRIRQTFKMTEEDRKIGKNRGLR